MEVTITNPRDHRDRENIYHFLYEIWNNEFQRNIEGINHAKKQIRDDLDDWANHIIAVNETGKIVGCVRNNLLCNGIPGKKLSNAMGFKKLKKSFGSDRVSYTSHLAVSPAYRGSTVVSLLLAELCKTILNQNVVADTSYCQLNLVNLYYRLGARPYIPHFRIDVGVRVPLIGCIMDRNYLKKTESPLLMIVPETKDDCGETAKSVKMVFPDFCEPGFDKLSTRATWAQLAHISPFESKNKGTKLFRGISKDDISGLIQRLPRLNFSSGQLIHKKGECEKCMGILLSGSLGVGVGVDEKNPHFINVLRPGEPFGELNILGDVKHSANFVALEKSEVILFPDNMFDRIEKKNPSIATQLYKNTISILADRIAESNGKISEIIGKNNTRDLCIRHQPIQKIRSSNNKKNRVESYHFDTLSDRESEYKRLVEQASVAEDMEFSMLKKIGLTNSDSVLDLGSGPGVTSSILSRRLPDSQITGVEPEKQLRLKAKQHARELGIKRCRFIDGTAQSIPLPDDSIDFSYARLLFQHIPDHLSALNEMKRVTRKGGIACVMDVDDGTIFIHPEVPEWNEIEMRVSKAQANSGGDRHVGRKISGYMTKAGFSDIHVDIVPVTTDILGPEMFYEIVFGFKQQILKRADDWDMETGQIFKKIKSVIKRKGAFASENIFVTHGMVP